MKFFSMSKKEYYKFSLEFNDRLIKNISSNIKISEMLYYKVGKHYSSTFNVYLATNPDFQMETTITKKTLFELENGIIEFLKK